MKTKSPLLHVYLVLIASISILMLSSAFTGQQQTASVKTNAVKNITTTSADGGYVITSSGVTITKHGICLSKGPGPTTKNMIFAAEKGPGPGYNVQITGLTPGGKCYIRAFITTSTGTIYGNEISFTTAVKK